MKKIFNITEVSPLLTAGLILKDTKQELYWRMTEGGCFQISRSSCFMINVCQKNNIEDLYRASEYSLFSKWIIYEKSVTVDIEKALLVKILRYTLDNSRHFFHMH